MDTNTIKMITCCLGNSQHYIKKCVRLKCGGNCCWECTRRLISVFCNHCQIRHEPSYFNDTILIDDIMNKLVEKDIDCIYNEIEADLLRKLDVNGKACIF